MVPLLVCAKGDDAGLFDGCYGAGANACVAMQAAGGMAPEVVRDIAAYWLGANEVPPPA
jgi:hypothetical protein